MNGTYTTTIQIKYIAFAASHVCSIFTNSIGVVTFCIASLAFSSSTSKWRMAPYGD